MRYGKLNSAMIPLCSPTRTNFVTPIFSLFFLCPPPLDPNLFAIYDAMNLHFCQQATTILNLAIFLFALLSLCGTTFAAKKTITVDGFTLLLTPMERYTDPNTTASFVTSMRDKAIQKIESMDDGRRDTTMKDAITYIC